jgi:hypothetical protein
LVTLIVTWSQERALVHVPVCPAVSKIPMPSLVCVCCVDVPVGTDTLDQFADMSVKFERAV